MNRAAALGALAIVAGFVAGFLWGARTREELPAATSTTLEDGKVVVRIDPGQALGNGLRSIL